MAGEILDNQQICLNNKGSNSKTGEISKKISSKSSSILNLQKVDILVICEEIKILLIEAEEKLHSFFLDALVEKIKIAKKFKIKNVDNDLLLADVENRISSLRKVVLSEEIKILLIEAEEKLHSFFLDALVEKIKIAKKFKIKNVDNDLSLADVENRIADLRKNLKNGSNNGNKQRTRTSKLSKKPYYNGVLSKKGNHDGDFSICEQISEQIKFFNKEILLKLKEMIIGLNLPTNSKVLFLGPGITPLQFLLAKLGHSVNIIEKSPGIQKNIKLINDKLGILDANHLILGDDNSDIFKMKLEENSYDIIFALSILDLLKENQEIYTKILKAVKNEGKIAIGHFDIGIGTREQHCLQNYAKELGYYAKDLKILIDEGHLTTNSWYCRDSSLFQIYKNSGHKIEEVKKDFTFSDALKCIASPGI